MAVLAFIGWQAMLLAEHDRIDMRRNVDWRFGIGDTDFVRITLVNVGLGPAIARDQELQLDGERPGRAGFHVCDRLRPWLDRAGYVVPRAPREHCFTLPVSRNTYLRGGDDVFLYRFSQREPTDFPAARS